MEDLLPGVGSSVENDPVAGLGDASLGSDPRGGEDEVSHELPVLGRQGVVRGDVLEGHEEQVHRCLGIDVLEGNASFIAHHELGGDVAVPDLAEHAIGHGRGLCPAFPTNVMGASRHGRHACVRGAPGVAGAEPPRSGRTLDLLGGMLVSSARWVCLAALLPYAALAEPRTYRVAPTAEGSKAEAVVVYSLGTHAQVAQDIRGEVTLDPTTLAGGSGTVVVPIAGIRGDGSTRDCHMREALGLDYSAGGRFPKEHVCDGENRLPASGPESIAFPDIRLEILGARPLDELSLLDAGKPVRVELDARWTMHGVSRQQKELTRVVREGNGLHARGRSTVVLADYGIVVKATKVVFAEIKVGDAVAVTYDLRLLPVEPGTPAPTPQGKSGR